MQAQDNGTAFRRVDTARRAPARQLAKLLACSVFAATHFAWAGATIKIDDDKSISIGAGLRSSFTSVEDGAPNGTSRSKDFELDNVRLYLGGQINKFIKATFNTERKADDSVRVMDAIAQFEFSEPFNLWLGRMLPPSDRANLDGPFYLNVWEYPGVVSNYPNLAVGRDNGVLAWGKVADRRLVYSVGAFKGHNNELGLSNESDELLYAGRLAINFWEPEPAPAYYTGSTYYGAKDILTLALVGQYQKDGVGVATRRGDFLAWNVDLLMEKKLGTAGVLTLEGAYYDYDLDGVPDCNSGEPGSVACPATGNNIGGQVEGKAWLATAAYLLPGKIGWGQFQPYVRYQRFERELSDTEKEQADIGVNYVIDGHNARLSAVYSRVKDNQLSGSAAEVDKFILGAQLQY